MRKCVIVPDSFKGTMSAVRVCEIMGQKVKEHFSECEITAIPVADGGEGTVDCFLYALDGRRLSVETTGPFGDKILAEYAVFGDTAVIETASAAGITLGQGRLNPLEATTYGLGALVKSALENGCKKIILGLGGSCTNDGGVGIAAALGARFYTQSGEEFLPKPHEYTRIGNIDCTSVRELLKNVSIEAMCDIKNPMYGEEGAAYVFAPQKGADSQMVEILDLNLRALDQAIQKSLGLSVAQVPGSGAAGALGAGVLAFLGGSLKSGIETVLDVVAFDDKIRDADMIFTGEGKIDAQSVCGKVIAGVGRRAKLQNIPVVVAAGCRGDGAEEAYEMGVSAIFSTCLEPKSFEEMRGDSEEYLEKTMDSILRVIKVAQGGL
ncbi:MAG: glycerate kinase [Eubacteriales bacterium]|nr:glycerate kinase [Eubacteriales bacterium]